ncbi:MAG: UDP-glucose 4-epimerase GalE [Actinobacteria bacterium]|jgi:UDP-glucose 4-epimerase|nr:UDP-glucose 4-epimerase GalE [Actinomycetota bacterium]NDH80674.1 UDP-glucose 4-epimerase GalE [Actinomycetota bacterium]NDI07536.1 UDP-glucose 4-epimerase GalE [Actinomycetota bacterium]
MKILVTGGAGYIGSHAVEILKNSGHDVTVLDDCSTGHVDSLPPTVRFVQGSLLDSEMVARALKGCEAVMHFAGKSLVGESVEKPDLYRKVNVDGTKVLLDQMNIAGIKKIVFSSSAATYGEPESSPVSETAQCAPTNPYGQTKLAIERELTTVAQTQGFAAVSLRYFNVAGALQTQRGWIAERHDPETHLIPNALRATSDSPLRIFGRDWNTPDGTCVRDYVHIIDLIDAHVRALKFLSPSEHHVFNIGSGTGYSVAQVVAAASRVKNNNLATVDAPRRAGDPAVLVANIDKAEMILNWRPERSLDQMVEDTFKAS